MKTEQSTFAPAALSIEPAEISVMGRSKYAYTIATLVTNIGEYQEMLMSFEKAGFGPEDCEYLFVDNSVCNRLDAFKSYNIFLNCAKGRHIILCHQDVLLSFDIRERLDVLLDGLYSLDPMWGVCGNAGKTVDDEFVIRITDPNGEDQCIGGPYPRKVMSLDENFIVARKDANLALSHDLSGFHWYGADLSLICATLGLNSYVIDFHLKHKSGGKRDLSFEETRRALTNKYSSLMRSRWHHAPFMAVYLTGWPVRAYIARSISYLKRSTSKLLRSSTERSAE